ncbi:hypothetical protein CHUAL_001967 [Chamberlinius hualienensis]
MCKNTRKATVSAETTLWITTPSSTVINMSTLLKRLLSLLQCIKMTAFANNNSVEHISRRKTNLELVRMSAAVMGIELCYAAETAFVSPTLLNVGLPYKFMSLIWCLSPLLGFFVTPILGSLSDRCTSSLGRRRPFILLLSFGILLGLIFVPYGAAIGNIDNGNNKHVGVVLTIIGTVLLDFDCDACQSPARAYLLDNTLPEDHAIGLSTFTVMAGIGGTFGYAMGAIDWTTTTFGQHIGGQMWSVFTIIAIIYVICVIATLTSFKEVPLKLQSNGNKPQYLNSYEKFENEDEDDANSQTRNYGTVSETSFSSEVHSIVENGSIDRQEVSLKNYMSSIIHMPKMLRLVCLTNFFSWMSLVSYSLYFTDFVAEAIFNGDPKANPRSPSRLRYEEGVRFGCVGMAIYSLSCSIYSAIIEKLIRKCGPRLVYIGGHLVYSVGMLLMAILRHQLAVLLLSCASGVMYATLFTMPYLLVAHYHSTNAFEENGLKRGLGTDVAVVNSMIFLAQFALSSCVGSIVHFVGSTTAILCGASIFSVCGAITANFVNYTDL